MFQMTEMSKNQHPSEPTSGGEIRKLKAQVIGGTVGRSGHKDPAKKKNPFKNWSIHQISSSIFDFN